MKLLIIHNFYKEYGGEDQSVVRLRSLFKKKGYSVVWYFSYNKEIDDYKIRDWLLLPFKTIFSFKTYRNIINLIKKENPELAHIQNVFPLISPSVYYALKKMNIPVVQRLSNYRLLCPNGLFFNNSNEICELCNNGNYLHGILRKCYRNSFLQTLILSASLYLHWKLHTFQKKIDVFITPSQFFRKKLIARGIPEEKIFVKESFIDLDNLKPNYNFENYAVYIGRISREKGLFTLLQAFKEIPHLMLKVIGNGPLYPELVDFANANKILNVEFIGFLEGMEKYEILKKAMFMIIPSECFDCFPNVLLESFAVGTPVIASDVSSLSEGIENGKNGLLFRTGDYLDLKQKILDLAQDSDLNISMRYYSRKCAEEKHSERVVFQTLKKLYEDVLGKYNSMRRNE